VPGAPDLTLRLGAHAQSPAPLNSDGNCHDLPPSHMQLRKPGRSHPRRAGARLRLPLPRVPEAHGQRVRCAGAVRTGRGDDRGAQQGVRPGRRERQHRAVPVLRRVRRHRVLAGRRPAGLRHRGGWCLCRSSFSPAAGVGLRGASARLGGPAGRYGTLLRLGSGVRGHGRSLRYRGLGATLGVSDYSSLAGIEARLVKNLVRHQRKAHD
jgi:hypothetical protein